jgi:PilZ domain
MADPPKPSGSERRYPRIPVVTPAEVRITAPGLTSTGYLLDTSDGGLAIAVAGGPLPVGEVVTLELLVKSPEKLPPLRATVRYSKGIRHGLQFLPEQ